MEEPTIDLYMTVSPHTIAPDATLAAAHGLMRTHGIRHLPVVDGEALVGVVSLRDLYFMETLDGVEPEQVAVREAMRDETYAVGPDAALRKVAAHMADQKLGSAVVIDGGKVIGIFTAVDGLRALSLLLEQIRAAGR
jgi:acetoin utilization protein AcuB